jgi:hypothetical protein
VTEPPYSLVPSINVKKVDGYDHCGANETMWAAHAGDPNYNMLNECCTAMNSGNPGGLGFTSVAQKTMDFKINPGQGRDDFVRYWRLMAEAVQHHPSAFGFELENEPMTIHREKYVCGPCEMHAKRTLEQTSQPRHRVLATSPARSTDQLQCACCTCQKLQESGDLYRLGAQRGISACMSA